MMADARVLTACRTLALARGAAAAAAAAAPRDTSLARDNDNVQPARGGAPRPPESLSAVQLVALSALRVLAILGDNESLSAGLCMGIGRQIPFKVQQQRGVRVLSVDGGGVKGIASIRMLKELEEMCGRPLYEEFDLIVGASAGGIIVR